MAATHLRPSPRARRPATAPPNTVCPAIAPPPPEALPLLRSGGASAAADAALEEHPVETQEYLLTTPAIERLANQCVAWIDARNPGGLVHGTQRAGKTKSVQVIRLILRQARPRLHTELLLCKRYQNPSERGFFEDLLRAVGHAVVEPGSNGAKRERLAQYLSEQARVRRDNRVVLFCDDAQRLGVPHYEWLMDLHNDLEKLRTHLITILVGQPEMVFKRNGFIVSREHHIVARFMTHLTEFSGLLSAGEAGRCLEGYDDPASDWPVDSGVSFTGHYFPRAAAAGWRLANLADDLWAAFGRVHSAGKAPALVELPMQYFCRSVEHILRVCGPQCGAAPTFSAQQIDSAVASSGYHPYVASWGGLAPAEAA